jgi:Bifunctional DNA primase/polymerase, N-terminal
MALIIKQSELLNQLLLAHAALNLHPAPADNVVAMSALANALSCGELSVSPATDCQEEPSQQAQAKLSDPSEPAAVIAIDCNEEAAPQTPEVVDPRLQQVLDLAKRGFKLFPLAAQTKIPMKGFAWTQLATNGAAQLRVWFDQFPNCNWGAATGPCSGVFVLDIDGETGRDSLGSLANQGFTLPSTLTTETGNPLSHHLYFKYPGDETTLRNSASKLGPGLDIRAQGGYVVVPPSVHPSGKSYCFVDKYDEIQNAPNWLLELIANPPVPHEEHLADIGPGCIPIGQRDDTLFRDACAMRRRSATEEEILAFLKEKNKTMPETALGAATPEDRTLGLHIPPCGSKR